MRLPQSCIIAALMMGWCSLKARGDDKQEWLQEELCRACESGSLEEVKKLLAEGASAKLVSESYGELPLNRAISMGHEELVKLLVKHGAPLNAPEESALAVAAKGVSFPYSESGTMKMIDLLLTLGADVHANDEEAIAAAAGKTSSIVQRLEKAGGKATRRALVTAVRSCHLDIVEHLVKAGLDPTTTDENGRTLLHEAADWTATHSGGESGKQEMLWGRLLALGISVNARDRKGRTPIFEASTFEVMRWLIEKKADVNLKDNQGGTALMKAAGDASDWTEMMQLLLKAGADLKAKDQKGRTALEYAAEVEAWGEVTLLLEEGAVADHAADMVTAMAHATLDHSTPQENVARITAHLLRQIADPNALRVDGLPLLSWAVLINQPELVKVLLKAGVDMNAEDAEGRIPLMMAALAGNGAMKALLLKAGADSSRKNKQGLTADNLAPFSKTKGGHLASGLSDGSSQPDVPTLKDDIFSAIAADQIEEVKRLVGDNPGLLVQVRGGLQPLHLAVALGRVPVVEWLVKNGATLSAKILDKQSCLVLAVQANQAEMARWLMTQQDVSDHAEVMKDLHGCWTEPPRGSRDMSEVMKKGCPLALRLAIEAGWRPENTEKGQEAVEVAVCWNDLTLTRKLLAIGATPTPAKNENADPFSSGEPRQNLMLAALQNHSAEMLKLLLEKTSSQLMAWREDIAVALNFAASAGDLSAVKLLVEQGMADVNAGTQRYHGSGWQWHSLEDKTILFTPICHALENSRQEVIDYLLQKGAKPVGQDGGARQVLASAVATRNIELVRLMLDHGAALEARSWDGSTALHEAVRHDVSDISALLLSKGANREAKDSAGRTPAQLAESLGRTFP